MMNSIEVEEDLFFDSVDRFNVDDCAFSDEKLEYEFWLDEPCSVRERRSSFLRDMGLAVDDDIGRVAEFSGAVSSSSSVDGDDENVVSCCRDLDTEGNVMVDELEQSISLNSSQLCEEMEEGQCREKRNAAKKDWWKILSNLRTFKGKASMKQLKIDGGKLLPNRVKVKQNQKRFAECTGIYKEQEFHGHEGIIWTMKFSPDGQYLATGGEDGIIRIWLVTSVDSSRNSYASSPSSNTKKTKKAQDASVLIPQKVFQIKETPLQEFRGHSSDVLDLAWSDSYLLLSCSMDKTVRLWHLECDQCLGVFQHSDYVTCVQFNPVYRNYFITGSIDGKVRIWGVNKQRVLHWADVRDVISAISFKPDGKGFAVGTIMGTCRFYQILHNELELEAEIKAQGKRRTCSNRVTSIQFLEEESQVMISSEDGKIRIFNGIDVVHKFKGLKSGGQIMANFTSTMKHIVSVGEDCRVYVWNFNGIHAQSNKYVKSVRTCEHFVSEGVSVAVPWTGIGSDKGDVSNRSVQADEGVSLRKDSNRFPLGSWFSSVVNSSFHSGSATWPEEKLPCFEADRDDDYLDENEKLLLPYTWGLVIVTAGLDGTIRVFQNHGLPIKL